MSMANKELKYEDGNQGYCSDLKASGGGQVQYQYINAHFKSKYNHTCLHNKDDKCKSCKLLNPEISTILGMCTCQQLVKNEIKATTVKEKRELSVYGYCREEYINKYNMNYPTVLMKMSYKYLGMYDTFQYKEALGYNIGELYQRTYRSVGGEAVRLISESSGNRGFINKWTVKVTSDEGKDILFNKGHVEIGIAIFEMKKDGEFLLKEEKGNIRRVKADTMVTVELDLKNSVDRKGNIGQLNFGFDGQQDGESVHVWMHNSYRLFVKLMDPGMTVEIY